MKNGILREDEGYDILVNGQSLTFRDVKAIAVATACFLRSQKKHMADKIEVRERSTGTKAEMLADGRTA